MKIVFGKEWFVEHQKVLLWFANTWIGRRFFRIDSKDKIVGILPNSIFFKKGTSYVGEFRTHDRYAKRLYFGLKPLWYLFHYWDMITKPIPALDLGFATLTVYPAAGTGGTTVDGEVYRNGANEVLGTIRAGAGTGNDPTGATQNWMNLTASGTSNQYENMKRGIALFDTSALTASATISAAVMSLYVTTVVNGLSGGGSANSAIVCVASTPASNGNLANTDFGQLGSTDFGRSVSQVNLTTSAYNDITLNASGLAAISKTSISKFGFRYGWDFDNTTTGLTWASTAQQAINVATADTASTTSDPKLVVTYTLPSTAGGSFLLNFA